MSLAATSQAVAEQIRIASWNVANLHHEIGVPLRRGAAARSAEDFAVLKQYAEQLAADVIALQEVGSPAAVARLFPPEMYQIHLSGRYYKDQASGANSDRIYTAYAIRNTPALKVLQIRDIPALGVTHRHANAPDRPTRYGLELRLQLNQSRFWLLNVHLKSACHVGALKPARTPHCATLAAQLPELEQWLDARVTRGQAAMILGDFNRRFDVYGKRDHLWSALDDGEPHGLALKRLPFEQLSQCWRERPSLHHKSFIDFFVFEMQTWRWVVPNSFKQWLYEPDHVILAERLSDHCPLTVDLEIADQSAVE